MGSELARRCMNSIDIQMPFRSLSKTLRLFRYIQVYPILKTDVPRYRLKALEDSPINAEKIMRRN